MDYGEDHSKACGHTRFGRIYHTGREILNNKYCTVHCYGLSSFGLIVLKFGAGHYPVWDEHNPVHFVGHSAGAQVVRVLHQMLADKVHTREMIFSFTHK